MLDPKMAAAKIHRSDTGAHGIPINPARMTPSSHGCGKIFAIVQKVFPHREALREAAIGTQDLGVDPAALRAGKE
jgi:hypothetical protein